MESILSSASILMAAIALIYSFYQKEISDAQEYKIPIQFAAAIPKYNEIKKLTYGKLLPLTIFTGVIVLVYLPPVISAIGETFTFLFTLGLPGVYAPNLAALVMIEFFLVYLLVIFIGILAGLVKKLKRIREDGK